MNVSSRGEAADRFLDAVTEVSARDGYARLTVTRILAAADLGRATFYQYFYDVEDCFLSAYRKHAQCLVGEIGEAVRASASPEQIALSTLVDTAVGRPDIARVLMCEALVAGPAGFAARDALMAAIGETIDAARRGRQGVDLPIPTLIGGVFRFLSMHLLVDGRVDGALGEDLLDWARAFARPQLEPLRWRGWLVPATGGLAVERWTPSESLRGGKPRERIVSAAVASFWKKGYGATTVADIVVAAGVSRRNFYNQFKSKADAATAIFEQGLQEILAACTPAFFRGGSRPERVWNSAQAFTGVLEREPGLAHLGFVESHLIGPDFVPRIHETQLAFTVFLQEGYTQGAPGRPRSRACLSLTAAAIMEVFFQAARRDPRLCLRPSQPLAVFIALAPFIGPDQASEFVEGKLSAPRLG